MRFPAAATKSHKLKRLCTLRRSASCGETKAVSQGEQPTANAVKLEQLVALNDEMAALVAPAGRWNMDWPNWAATSPGDWVKSALGWSNASGPASPWKKCLSGRTVTFQRSGGPSFARVSGPGACSTAVEGMAKAGRRFRVAGAHRALSCLSVDRRGDGLRGNRFRVEPPGPHGAVDPRRRSTGPGRGAAIGRLAGPNGRLLGALAASDRCSPSRDLVAASGSPRHDPLGQLSRQPPPSRATCAARRSGSDIC